MSADNPPSDRIERRCAFVPTWTKTRRRCTRRGTHKLYRDIDDPTHVAWTCSKHRDQFPEGDFTL